MDLGDIKVRAQVVTLGSIPHAANRFAAPRSSLARRRGLTAIALAFTLGCERPATEVVVRVDSEIAWGLGQRLQSVVLEVRRAGPDGPLRSRQVTPVGTGAGRRPLPLFVGVSESVGDPTTPLWIEALGCAQDSGCARSGAVSAQRAVVRFVPEQTVELALLLSPACGAARCSLDQSCTPSGNCLPASNAQSTLRPIAGVPADAASAAATSDATATDATATDATTADAAMDTPAPPDAPRPPDGAPMGDAEPIDRPDAAPTDRPDATPTDRPDAAPTDRPTSDDVPVDAAPSDLPGDVRPADAGPMDAGPMDVGADAPPDTALTDAGPRDTAPDASPADAMDATPADAMDASPMDTGPADVGPTLRCPAGMVLAPAGEFLMGSNALSFERPIHRVRLSAFCIDVTEVTVAAFRACPLTSCGQPATNSMCNHRGVTGRDTHPVNCVDWSQAAGYCEWSGGRLPSEAQWEYAARGTDGRVYPWGNTFEVDRLCMNPLAPLTSTCPVNSYPRGDSPFGVADMGGNVSEWVLDTYAPYTGSVDVAVMDPVITGTGVQRVIRGSAFNADNRFPEELGRASRRGTMLESVGIFQIGFRCVRTPLSP